MEALTKGFVTATPSMAVDLFVIFVPGTLICPPSKYLVGTSVFFSFTKSTIEAFNGKPVLVTSLP